MYILAAHISMYDVHVMPEEAKKGYRILGN